MTSNLDISKLNVDKIGAPLTHNRAGDDSINHQIVALAIAQGASGKNDEIL